MAAPGRADALVLGVGVSDAASGWGREPQLSTLCPAVLAVPPLRAGVGILALQKIKRDQFLMGSLTHRMGLGGQ